MAWQLIYTSAPRLLEAGRSGFGTVARHRAIPALLAGAIERVSQFSRLPGQAEHRIIYSHRHMSAGGARYHVISRICDSGADYTGRTNHIAHHLIVEAGEAAASGVSPADIMLSFAWKDHWDDQPRYFETAEEISPGSIPRTIRLPAKWWERAAGNARYAALLTAPEVSRGCYLVYAGDTLRDPRQQTAVLLFGESLLLAPERMWSIPFTSNFQPSDESADFLWSGVWADSPMRGQAEQSGRAVFHLEPDGTVRTGTEGAAPVPRGPAAEFAQTGRSATPPRIAAPEAIPGAGFPGPAARPALPKSREPALSTPLPAGHSAGKTQFPPASLPPRGAKFPWALAVSLAGGIVLLSGLGFFIVKKLQRSSELAAAIADELKNVPGHRESDAADLLRQIGNGRSREDVEDIAATAQDLADKWLKALKTTAWNKDAEDAVQDVKKLQQYNVTQPESIPAFAKLAQDWFGLREKVLSGKITDEKSYGDYASLCRRLATEDAPVDLEPARDALLQKNAGTRADFLLDSLKTRPRQDQDTGWFRKKIDAIRGDLKGVQITDDALAENLETLDRIIALWAAVEKSGKENKPAEELRKDQFRESDRAPAWLVAEANDLLTPKANAFATIPSPTPEIHAKPQPKLPPSEEDELKNGTLTIYIVIGDDGLKEVGFPSDFRNLSLVKEGTLCALGASGEYFKHGKFWFKASTLNNKHTLSHEKSGGDGGVQPPPPFTLKGEIQDATATKFEIRVMDTAPSEDPKPLKFTGGLKIAGNQIALGEGFAKLDTDLILPAGAKLKLPENFNPTPTEFAFPLSLPLTRDKAFASDVSQLVKHIMDRKKDIEYQLGQSGPNPAVSDDTRDKIKKQLEELGKKLKTDSMKKHLPEADLPPGEIIRQLQNLTRTTEGGRSDKERKAMDEDIKSLNLAIDYILELHVNLGPPPAVDPAIQQKNKNELDALKKSPLPGGKLPGGTYSIVIGDAGHETTLVEFAVPNP